MLRFRSHPVVPMIGLGRQRTRWPARYVPQPQRHVVAVAQVADGGDAGHEAGACGRVHVAQNRVIVGAGEVTDRVVAGVEGQVDVRVDQTGQHGRVAQVHHVNPGRRRRFGLDRHDAAPVNQHYRSLDQVRIDAVEQARGTDREHDPARLLRRPERVEALDSVSSVYGT
jgi:hypothetical protein